MLGKVLFTDISASDARRWRRPVTDGDSVAGSSPDGWLTGEADLEVTLAPDLDVEDPLVQFLVGMRSVKGIHLLSPESLARRLGSPSGLTTWSIEGEGNGHYTAKWVTGSRTTYAGPGYATSYTDADVRRLYGPKLDAGDDVIDHWQAFQIHMARGRAGRIFVTGRDAILDSRWSGGVPGGHGQVSPAEAVHIITLAARSRGDYVVHADAASASLHVLDPFTWASATAQALVPAYLPYHAAVVDECAASDASSLALDQVEGVFRWVRLLVLALDRLAGAHLREACIGSNNWTMLQQSDSVAAALQACAGSLEALAGLIAQRAGTASTAKERRTVSFPSLLARTKPWSKQLGRYDSAASRAATGATGPTGLATAMREQGFHHHPLSIRSAAFGHVVNVVDASGQAVPRFIEEVSMGALQPTGDPADPAWATHGEDGILLQGDEPPYILPWPYVRAVSRELVLCLNSTLAEIAAIEAIPSGADSQPATAFLGMQLDHGILRTSLGL